MPQPKVVKQMPGPIEDLAVGGGGRYLVLYLRTLSKLAVFDVNATRVVHYLPIDEPNIKFAAGLDRLAVVYCASGKIERWNLASGARELTTILPFPGKVATAVMGSSSQGPLLLCEEDHLPQMHFLDIQTMKRLAVQKQGNRRIHLGSDGIVRASANGRVFGFWRTATSPQGLQSLVLIDNEIRDYYEHTSVGHVVPGPDGKVLYTARGRYNEQTKPLRLGNNDGPYCLPAHHGDYYLAMQFGNAAGNPRAANPVTQGAVYSTFDDRPLVHLQDAGILAGINQWEGAPFTVDKRVHLIPLAKLIITVPATNDRLVLQRFDVEEALEKSGVDYLLVTSQPPVSAKKKDTFKYQMTVKSKQGGVQYRLESGPTGMQISNSGEVTWPIPADCKEAESVVIIAVKDKSGQEVFHTFKMVVSD